MPTELLTGFLTDTLRVLVAALFSGAKAKDIEDLSELRPKT